MTTNTRSQNSTHNEDFPSILEGLEFSPPKNRREIKALFNKKDKRPRANGSTPTKQDARNQAKMKSTTDQEDDFDPMDSGGSLGTPNRGTNNQIMENSSKEQAAGLEPMDTSGSLGNSKRNELMDKAIDLARKLDDSLKQVDNRSSDPPPDNVLRKPTTTGKAHTTSSAEPQNNNTKALSFSKDTQFSGSGPAISRKANLSTPKYTTIAKSPSAPTPTISKQKQATSKLTTPKAPPEPRQLADDPEPEDQVPEAVEHLYSFVARIEVGVPACNSIPIKILNILAYAISVLRRADPSAAFLHLKDSNRQAGSIQEFPRFQEFYRNWAKFDHVMENFRNYRLDGNKMRKFTLSAVIGCNTPPKDLLMDCFIDFDREISKAHGGGKVSIEFKQLQVVDTNRNWILFGVPANTHPESFMNMTRPILQEAMHKMAGKNPAKYPASKYGGELPEFAICCTYVLNVPYDLSKDLDNKYKRCIHFEIRSSDEERFGNIFKYMGLSRLDKKYFGELARFFEGPGLEGTQAQKEDLGRMLQNHVAVTKSMGKITLPGIMQIDKIMACKLSVDADGDERQDVHISLRRILMKQRINKPRIWQCILPNAKGGWEGYYANGFGCGAHKQQALMWAASVGSHTRFHLLKRGVLPESVAAFIHTVFTNTAAEEAFGAKLINGEVFTSGAATAASMSLAIQNSDWVDVSHGSVEAKSGDGIYSRPIIPLQFNTDLREHNYAIDRNPDIHDSGSVAYSTGGNTTLGDTIIEIEDDHVEEVRIIDGDDTGSVAASSIGSTDSIDWGIKIVKPKGTTGTNTSTVIDNIEVIANESNTSPQTSQQFRTIEELHMELAQLRASNAELAAAAIAADNQVSHPIAPQDAAEAKGGGGH